MFPKQKNQNEKIEDLSAEVTVLREEILRLGAQFNKIIEAQIPPDDLPIVEAVIKKADYGLSPSAVHKILLAYEEIRAPDEPNPQEPGEKVNCHYCGKELTGEAMAFIGPDDTPICFPTCREFNIPKKKKNKKPLLEGHVKQAKKKKPKTKDQEGIL